MANQSADRLDIAETLYRYSEAIDIIGANPIERGEPDPGRERAAEVLRSVLTEDGKVNLYFEGRDGPATPAGDGGADEFTEFVREYFTSYGYVQTYHVVGNVRVAFDGEDAADVRSYIDSNHWMADGRFLSAPIEYEDRFVRVPGAGWRIADRKIVVWRWWVTDGYAPDPTDPSLARPA